MALQDDIQFYQRRRTLFFVLAVLVGIYTIRLIQLQFLYHEEYGKKSEENSIRTIMKEPVRGYIFDRNGRLVVDNRPSFTVTIMPYEFDRRTARPLARLLSLDPEFIADRLKKGEAYSRFAPVKIRRDLDHMTIAALEENSDRLPGVGIQIESKRAYVSGARASHVLGYLKEISESQLRNLTAEYAPGDVVGSSGIEAQYERTMKGTKGSEFSVVNVRGQVVGSFENGRNDLPPVDGENLVLTMDFDLQAYAESLMADRRGAVVAIDPRNGGILAMVSKPDFDLSLFSGVTSPELWRALNEDESKPLFNRATLTRYPPGSTFKMIAAIAALENNVVSPSWRVQCGGAFRFGNKVFKDLHVHGSTNMVEAIQRSCNVYFYQLILKIGLDRWAQIGQQFGFGQLTGIDIAEESPGLLPTTAYMNRRYGPTGWTRGFLVSLGIGQGELGVTPLQMAGYAMALANRGEYHQPHTVLGLASRTTPTRVDTLLSQTRPIVLSPSTWDIVREGMRRVVMEPGGTGSLARVKGIQVAGKTGTAQNPHGLDHAWFIGFAPFDNPVIAIAVLVENAGFGGSYAAPIAGKCMERFIFGPPGAPAAPPSIPAAISEFRNTIIPSEGTNRN
jgi:penicillin-binding protein 2